MKDKKQKANPKNYVDNTHLHLNSHENNMHSFKMYFIISFILTLIFFTHVLEKQKSINTGSYSPCRNRLNYLLLIR